MRWTHWIFLAFGFVSGAFGRVKDSTVDPIFNLGMIVAMLGGVACCFYAVRKFDRDLDLEERRKGWDDCHFDQRRP